MMRVNGAALSRWTLFACTSAIYAAAARPVDAQGVIERYAQPGVGVAAKLGLGTGAPVNDFGLGYGFEIELGYLLPLPSPISHALELFVGAGLGRSKLRGMTQQSDERLPSNGFATFTVDQLSLPISLGLRGRVPLASERVAPYLALGYRGVAIADTTHTRVAGQAVADHEERVFAHGFFGSAGVELFFGPGAVFAELQVSYAARSDYLLRASAVGGLWGYLGYRWMFGRVEREQVEPDPPRAPASPLPAPAPEVREPEAPAPVEQSAQLRGEIRGHVRSFAGAPLRAAVIVEPGGLRAETSESGEFSLDVSPGKYTVSLQATGFKAQTRKVLVDEDGITVLNVELQGQ